MEFIHFCEFVDFFMWIFFVNIVFSLFFLFSLGYVELGLEVGESALSLFFSARGRPVAGLLSLYPQSPNHPTQQIRASPLYTFTVPLRI